MLIDFHAYAIIPLSTFRAKHLIYEFKLHTTQQLASVLPPEVLNTLNALQYLISPGRRAESAKSLHMGASAIQKKRLSENVISACHVQAICRKGCVAVWRRRRGGRGGGCYCVCWSLQGTAVQFNIMDVDRDSNFKPKGLITNCYLYFSRPMASLRCS